MKGARSKADSKNNALSVKQKRKARKAAKDPNKPKRPPSAFFVFMEGFRKKFKEEHPDNKSVSVVGKAGGEKWKSMSDADKAPYVEKAEQRKAEYEKKMKAYNKKLTEGGEGSDKSVSEVNDGEVEGDDGSDEEDE